MAAPRAPTGFPKPRRADTYAGYTKRCWAWIKRNKPRTYYTGEQKKSSRTLKPGAFPRITATIAGQWNGRPKAWR